MQFIEEAVSDKATVRTDDYKGSPLLSFGKDGAKQFRFGQGKARKLVAAIEEMGEDEFCALLRAFVNAGQSE